MDVSVEPATSDHIAARRRNDGAAESRQKRPGKEERGPDLAAQVRVELRLRHARAVHTHLVRPCPLSRRAQVGEQLDHHLDVADARQVREVHLFGGEHGGCEDRERTVLVPGCADRS